jgi:hypothetical protein
MTNFLNRLAARAIGAAPVAEPLLPARFSSAAGLVKGDAFSGMPAEISTVAAVADAIGRMASRERPRDATLPEEASSDAGGTTPSSRELTATGSMDASLVPEKQSADAGTDRRVFPRATLPMSEPASLPMDVSVVADHTTPPSLRAAADSRAETLIDADQTTLAADHFVPTGTTFGPSPRLSGLATQTSLRSSDAVTGPAGYSRRRDAAESAAEAPIIRVSIGRIEVRAQFPAAPSPANARNARPAAISLEEYLKQRREGKR